MAQAAARKGNLRKIPMVLGQMRKVQVKKARPLREPAKGAMDQEPVEAPTLSTDGQLVSPDQKGTLTLDSHQQDVTLSDKEIAEIQSAIKGEIEDMSRDLQKLIPDHWPESKQLGNNVPVYRPSPQESIKVPEPSTGFAKKMWFLKNYKNKLGRLTYRGLDRGRLDQSRLWKGSYTLTSLSRYVRLGMMSWTLSCYWTVLHPCTAKKPCTT